MKNTAERREDTFADHSPDIFVLDREFGTATWESAQGKMGTSKIEPGRRQNLGDVAFAWAVSIMELRTSEDADPFTDTVDSATGAITVEMGDATTRAQITQRVTEIFLRQHREFVFIAVICGHGARLMRWTRCGVTMTQSFNYVEDPTPLLRFTRWLATTSRAQQGFDSSVEPATASQRTALFLFREMLQENLTAAAEAEAENAAAAAAGKEETIPSAAMERLRIMLGLVDEMVEDEALYPFNQVRA